MGKRGGNVGGAGCALVSAGIVPFQGAMIMHKTTDDQEMDMDKNVDKFREIY